MIELEPEVIEAIESGKKVDAIKILRKIRGIGLKESKELVDLYSSENKPHSSSTHSHSGANSGAGTNIFFIMVFVVACYCIYNFYLS